MMNHHIFAYGHLRMSKSNLHYSMKVLYNQGHLYSTSLCFCVLVRNAILHTISRRLPRSKEELLEINGIGK